MATANLAGITLNWLPSSVESIDNVPVSDYLQVKSLYSVYQDPDALFNQLFYSPALAFQNNGDAFSLRSNPFGLNDTSSFIFANDTKPQVFSNFAYVVGNFTNINSGADLFSKFVLPATTTTSTQQATTTQPPLTTITGYPNNPVAAHPQGYTVGFFLDGYNDTCILVMSGFEGQNTQDTRDQLEQQQAIQDTLSNCTAAGKTKLIIDLSANGGGHVFSGLVLPKFISRSHC